MRASYSLGTPGIYHDVVGAHPFTTGITAGTCGELGGEVPSSMAELKVAKSRKGTEYAPPRDDAGNSLARLVRIVPLAFDTHGRWGSAGCKMLKRWARRRLQLPDATANVRVGGVYT